MEKNIGNTDRIVRIILGILILAAGIYYQSWLGVIGLIPLITGLINYCPLYSLLKISTAKKAK